MRAGVAAALKFLHVTFLMVGFGCESAIAVSSYDELRENQKPEEKMKAYYAKNPITMYRLEQLESEIYKDLLNLTQIVQARAKEFPSTEQYLQVFHNLSSYTNDYEDSTIKLLTEYKPGFTSKNPYRVAWNPLASLRMLQRMVHRLNPLLGVLQESTVPFVSEQCKKIAEKLDAWPYFELPKEEDAKELISHILLIQSSYHLRADDLIQGKVFNRDTKVTLTGADCISIAKVALDSKFYSQAVSWLLAALQTLDNGKDPQLLETAHNHLETAVEIHDQNWTQGNETYFTRPIGTDLKNLTHTADVLYEQHKADKRKLYIFHHLCMGNVLQSLKVQSELFCWYERKRSPYLAINPVKAELLSKVPIVVRYYEVLTDKQILAMGTSAEHDLAPSEVSNGKREYFDPKLRTSVEAVIYMEDFNETEQLSRKLSSITGLQLGIHPEDEEGLGVVVYGPGGFFNVHLDALEILSTEPLGDRIATMVLYLSDVELGGGTMLHYPGIVAEPIRGSGVFWYNLKADGRKNTKLYHGGCPIILGEKWIANKWVRAQNQFRAHPCQVGSNDYAFYANDVKLQ